MIKKLNDSKTMRKKLPNNELPLHGMWNKLRSQNLLEELIV